MKLNRLNTLLSGVLAGALPGAYLRNVATIGNANPITFSVKCVIKNSST